MDSAWIVFISISAFWGIVGLLVPLFIPKGPNKGIIQCSLMLTSFSCWVLYVVTFLVQLHPLVGPRMESTMIMNMAKEWGSGLKQG